MKSICNHVPKPPSLRRVQRFASPITLSTASWWYWSGNNTEAVPRGTGIADTGITVEYKLEVYVLQWHCKSMIRG